MSHSIRVSDEVFSKLKALAEPFVDTPETVINRLMDYYTSNQKKVERENIPDFLQEAGGDVVDLDPLNPGSLAHTKVIEATFEGAAATKWFDLAKVAHLGAYRYLNSQDSLMRMSRMNLRKGEKIENGFDYIPLINMSIQRADSNVTWKNVLHLAQQLSVPVAVDFEWRDKEGAANPGMKGRLAWKPNFQDTSAQEG